MTDKTIPMWEQNAHPFTPMKRPKGYRKRADRACFHNAAMLAIQGRGRYVEGFASSSGRFMVHHAWVTLDGVHAIEVTWQEPGVEYLGVEVPTKTIADAIVLSGLVVAQFELPAITLAQAKP